MSDRTDLVRGTLALMILKTLALDARHGIGIADRIAQLTRGSFVVKPGSLFPALHRMEQEGVIRGRWGETPEGRRAKYYELTAAGRRRLAEERRNWARVATAIAAVLKA